ncbi:MAG: DUF4097 family beta strand repeat protein [Lachnospiraceae bacterium]|nr:DUF4097 family beta strand repeat protein [Lachnospiraceae bacterium]
MKKFMKICGITVLIIFLLGVGMATIGKLGGGDRTLERQVLDGVFSFGSDVRDWGVRWLWNEEWNTYDLNMDNIFDYAYDVLRSGESVTDFNSEEIQNMELSLGGCKMILRESADGDFHVRAEKVQNFQTYVKGDTLYVNSLVSGSWSFSSNSTVITIEIPAGFQFEKVRMSLGAGEFTSDFLSSQEVKLELGGGDFTFENLTADALECELGAGRVTIEKLSIADMECEVGAGQIIIRDAETTGDLDFEVGMGDLEFTGSVPGNLEAECSMGQMRFHIEGSREGDHDYNLQCAAGNLRVGSTSFSGVAADKKIDNGTGSLYKLECAMGNLEVTFSE